MTAAAPTYDLVMLLDPEAEDAARAKPLEEARAAIESQGELLRHDEWGDRALQYAIQRRNAAEYHLLQFHAATPELLRTLDRSLRIADEVLRFRIIKLKPGVPDPPDMRNAPAPVPPRRPEPPVRAAEAPPASPAAEPAAAAPAQPESEGPGAAEEAPATPAEDAPEQDA
ncbi:MAG TPA: 30S ribosomal protein S6 [Solirubrobacteraceae bacterium]|jgi:small subunit ribosomal protein S6|nr:30S ribosomal protein S6 [Solirubrobacteraceae bacterium]